MGSPLRPILANIFMVEIENTLVPRFHQHVKKRRRYVGEIFVYVKNESFGFLNNTQLASP